MLPAKIQGDTADGRWAICSFRARAGHQQDEITASAGLSRTGRKEHADPVGGVGWACFISLMDAIVVCSLCSES